MKCKRTLSIGLVFLLLYHIQIDVDLDASICSKVPLIRAENLKVPTRGSRHEHKIKVLVEPGPGWLGWR